MPYTYFPEHEENVVIDFSCTTCDFEECQNELQPEMAVVRPSLLIKHQNGLFAARDMAAGTPSSTRQEGRLPKAGI